MSVSKLTVFLRTVAKSIILARIWRTVISPFTLSTRLYQRRVDKRKESERSAVAKQYGQHSRDYYLYCKETGRPFSKMTAVKARFREDIQNILMDIESLCHKDPKKTSDHAGRYWVFRDKLRERLNDFGSLKDVYEGLEKISSDPAFPYLMIKFNGLCEEFDLSSQLTCVLLMVRENRQTFLLRLIRL